MVKPIDQTKVTLAAPAKRLRSARTDGVRDLSARELADKAVQAMHAPVTYKPVETDGAARAAREILAVIENRSWAAA